MSDVKTLQWDSLISEKNLIAADFWAPWCPFCVKLKSIFESISKDYSEIKFVKVNFQDEEDLARRYVIQGIPVIKFFCEGIEVGEIVGYVSKDALKKEIEQIGKNASNCLKNSSIRK